MEIALVMSNFPNIIYSNCHNYVFRPQRKIFLQKNIQTLKSKYLLYFNFFFFFNRFSGPENWRFSIENISFITPFNVLIFLSFPRNLHISFYFSNYEIHESKGANGMHKHKKIKSNEEAEIKKIMQ